MAVCRRCQLRLEVSCHIFQNAAAIEPLPKPEAAKIGRNRGFEFVTNASLAEKLAAYSGRPTVPGVDFMNLSVLGKKFSDKLSPR
jgi:hypothetical protein